MADNRVLWQIGRPHKPGVPKTLHEFLKDRKTWPEFNYNVDGDPGSVAQPKCPGTLHIAGRKPFTKAQLDVIGSSTAKLNVHFTLDKNYKAGELTLIYDRFGSDVDRIHFDRDLLAQQKGAGEGKLKRYKHVFGKLAKGRHTLTFTTHGGIGNCHYIDFLRLTAAPADIKVLPPPGPAPIPEITICPFPGTMFPDGKEYIEIINEGKDPWDISGWTLFIQVCGLKFVFPAGTMILPGKVIRITINYVDVALGGFTFGSDRTVFKVDGELISLFDKDGEVVTCYGFGTMNPAPPDTSEHGEEEEAGGSSGGGAIVVTGGGASGAGASGGGAIVVTGGGGASGGGLSGVIDTSAVVTAALEHMNRQSVIVVLQQIVQEIDEHCRMFPGKIDDEIQKLRKELMVQIDVLRLSVDKYQVSINEINTTLSSLKTQFGDFFNDFELNVGGIVNSNLSIALPDIIQQISSTLDVTIQQKIETVIVQTDVQDLLLKLQELEGKLEILKKASQELDGGELTQVEILLKQILQNIDLSQVLVSMRIEVNGGSFRLNELLAILAGSDKLAAIHFTYSTGDISGARFVLVDGSDVTFVCGRRDLTQTSEVEYVFNTLSWKGLPASFTLRFRKHTTSLEMCKKTLALNSYDVVYQSNIVFSLDNGLPGRPLPCY